MQEAKDNFESKLIQIRGQIALRKFNLEQCGTIIDTIMKNLPKFIKKHKPPIHSMKSEESYNEISRRFSSLTRECITFYVNRAHELYRMLSFSISDAIIVEETINELTKRIPIIPGYCEIICPFTHEQIAISIAQTIIKLKDEHLAFFRKNPGSKKCPNRTIRYTINRKAVNFVEDVPQSESEDREPLGSQRLDKIVCDWYYFCFESLNNCHHSYRT